MSQYSPRVSAYGLLCQSDKMLLCRISSVLPRWEGSWTLPGGGIEFGEHPEAGMVREVEEETGLLCTAGSIVTVDSVYDESGDKPFHGIRLIYRARHTGGKLRNELHGTTDRCHWWSREEIDNLDLVDIAQLGVGLAFD